MNKSTYQPLYKTIVLAMLRRAETVLTRAQVMDFVLTSGYTNYMTLQETFAALSAPGLVREETEQGRTFLHLTQVGRETIDAVEEELRADIKRDIDNFLSKNRLSIRDESALRGDYSRLPDGSYEVRCDAYENGRRLYGLILEAPTEEAALHLIDNWKKQSAALYGDIILRLGSS